MIRKQLFLHFLCLSLLKHNIMAFKFSAENICHLIGKFGFRNTIVACNLEHSEKKLLLRDEMTVLPVFEAEKLLNHTTAFEENSMILCVDGSERKTIMSDFVGASSHNPWLIVGENLPTDPKSDKNGQNT